MKAPKKYIVRRYMRSENVRRVCGLGDVGADLVEEGTEGGGIAGFDDGGELGEFGADGA